MTAMRTMTLHRCDDRATIFLEGEIDLATAPAVGSAVQGCVSRGAGSIVVDLTRLTFCDASGLNAFLTASLYVGATGGRFWLRGATPTVRRVFDLTASAFLLDDPAAGSSSARARLPSALLMPGRSVVSGDR
ncbi:STAS domain-containing protein [Streptomyces sp. V4-01]|uniref:STAS domain-containing protein n=1 Tax=Actinacidiphila polyblastidii TaxID=3110430 RepID=A0ABU7PID2_9ACTN|nr:STAS domain-containing protein [Streptomyces sp. V4-01]